STKIGGGNNGGDAWDTNGVLNMAALFKNTDAFVQPIINWDVSTVTNMREMFAGHDNFNQDISGWTVDNVTNMEGMFAGASAFNQDISGWNTALVNDMSEMFENATSFNQDLGRVGGWDVSGVSDMRQMFRNASSFDQNLGGWDFSNLSGNDLINFLNNSGLSVTNYDNLLIGLDAQIASLSTTISNFGAQNIYYCGGESARAALLAHGWTFDDGGLKCISIFEGPDTASPEIVNGQPEAIEYGSTSTTKSKTYTIVNNQASPLVDVTISNPGVGFPTSVIIPTLGSGLPQNFTVDLTGPVGTYLETITITNATIPTVFTFDVHGEVTVTPEPEISVFEGSTGSGTPILNNQLPSFFLGTELRGNSLTRDFSIKNIGDAPLNITDISFPPGSEIQLVSIPPTSIPVDGVEIISLIITGTNAGAFLEQLSITSDDTDEPVFSFFVFAQIEGPDIWVVDGVDIFSDPEITNGQITPIDIGSGTFGTDVVKQLTITDATPVNLAVFDISISGTAFTFTPAAPFGVAGAVDGIYDEVLLEITLSGTTPGTFNEVVTITSDDEADPVFTFPITGTITSTGCTTLPTVNAGTDVSLCTGNTIALSGTIGGSATTATWSTAGTGTFDDNTLLN
ncbi:MAG TPA: BspA family leucine-rich repeat surface protein, partial [Cyclobacteriaceae bacterium]|nr:BspA family leucine-rich repeat surface protein [Cyclobacteriaceae bacterium]